MTNDELSLIGLKLYGNRWKAFLARAINVERETVSRWASGKQSISSTAVAAIRLLEQQKPSPHKERRYKAHGEIQQIGDAQLIHADCRKIALTDSIDAILTDPVWPNAIPELAGSDDPERLLCEALGHLSRFLKPDGRIIIQLRCDSDPRILRAAPKVFPFIRTAWLPYAVPSRKGRVLISGDVAYVFGKPPHTRIGNHVLPGQPHSDFCPPARTPKETTSHPCPRNLAHVEWLVEKFTSPGELILDPFMGSGTSAVAALNRGRKFIGVEIERKHWLECQRRIKEECQNIMLSPLNKEAHEPC